jgi:hypothetical protein
VREVNATYQESANDYDAEAIQVKAYRAELWERSRVCTRCGKVYLGTRLNSP